ncbi:MAG: protein-tyrosine phosphatase family protein [Pseudomonadota bacterium]
MLKKLAGLLRRLNACFLVNMPSARNPRSDPVKPQPPALQSTAFRTEETSSTVDIEKISLPTGQPAPSVQPVLPTAVATKIDRNALWIDKFLAKKQHQDLQNGMPPTFGRLLDLPTELRSQLHDLSAAKVVPSGLIAALWRALEANTRKHEHVWRFVETDGRFDYNDDAIPESDEASDAVFGRYRDVLLVRNTALLDRVRSKADDAPHFLHANRVDLGCGRRLIAGQKPVSGEILGFQQMLIEQDVGLIVDLTRNREEHQTGVYIPGGSAKPDEKLRRPEDYQVHVSCSETVKLKELPAIKQQFHLHDGNLSKQVQRLHFLEWPDHGVIAGDMLICLADKIEALALDRNRAIFMHCMAGMGRTGTLLSFLAARTRIGQMLSTGKTALSTEMVLRVAIEVVARGRVDRGPSFVQTEGQFSLLARTLLKDSLRKTSHE